MVNGPNFERVADVLLRACGSGRILDVSRDGALAAALLRRGADVHTAQRAGSLPYDDSSFDIVSVHGEAIPEADLAAALAEIRRVTGRSLFVWSFALPDGASVAPAERRTRWEMRCFAAGFRKHPAYHRVNDYESLDHEAPLVCIPLDKVPDAALDRFPAASLAEGRSVDMLRDSGARSDACVARYHWASRYVKPGDRVLDADCGVGYGTYVLTQLTDAASVTGIDEDPPAIDYARSNYPAKAERARYVAGSLPEAISTFPEGSFEAIVSFGTLSHVADPDALLAEFHRLLTPGGRVIVSVPNDYDWTRLKDEIAGRFIPEEAFAQTASRRKASGRSGESEWTSRMLRRVDFTEEPPAECEWWLVAGMKSPLDATVAYRERVFSNIGSSGHASIDYAGSYHNPWLMHAMVNVTWRLRNGAELEKLAERIMEFSPGESNDHAAALGVKAYRVLGREPVDATLATQLIARIDEVVARPPDGAMALRWKVSLLFVKAKLLQAVGRLAEARASFQECGRVDVRPFGIHLSTKPTEAWFLAGKISQALGDAEGARGDWESGVAYGDVLLSSSLEQILIDRRFPNRFNYGDGVREFTLAWDNISRCANGLHLLARGRPLDDAALETSFQTEYAEVVRAVSTAHADLVERTEELVDVRRALSERTRHVEADLQDRTRDLVETRATLVQRTRMLEAAAEDLRGRTEELVQTRQLLVDRTGLLEKAVEGLPAAAGELVEARRLLVERKRALEVASADLQLRTAELVETRGLVVERTRLLDAATRDLAERDVELAQVRRLLEERTRGLEEATGQLEERMRDLTRTRESLGTRTGQFDAASRELYQRTEELSAARTALAERERELDATNGLLAEAARLLADVRGELAKIAGGPFRFAFRSLYRRLLSRKTPEG